MSKERFVLDTNIWLYVVAGIPSASQFLLHLAEEQGTAIYYSSVTVIEIFSYPGLEDEKRLLFKQLLNVGTLVPVDERIAIKAAELRADASGVQVKI